ncbi:putative F-box protein At1g32420 [Cornus florida]|uniref:putative F-box protein At1g32420 n=1 Tax=Cornus florida TaxID=4283 RepID=UPI00289CD14A|nr:putative F-box protein At1g32420 [Cornus florida]
MKCKSESQLLSEDVVIDVLTRLSVKSLLRFRCVCKHWYSLIINSRFITNHLHQSSNSARLLVYHYTTTAEKNIIFSLFLDETLASFLLLHYDFDDVQVPNELGMLGSFNGILGLWHWDRIALWNLATREFRKVLMPKPHLPSHFYVYHCYYGLGLDPATTDYKVVLIRNYWDREKNDPYFPRVVTVYNLFTDSWRLFEDSSPSSFVYESSSNTYMNGLYYWLTNDDTNQFYAILSFDMRNEVFRHVPGLPNLSQMECGVVVMYIDSIALIYFDRQKAEKHFDIWVMEEYGCWTKQLTIGPLLDVEWPLGFWKNGELFLKTGTEDLVLYDQNTREIKNLQHHECDIFMYKESLVSVSGENKGREGEDRSNMARLKDSLPFHPRGTQKISNG